MQQLFSTKQKSFYRLLFQTALPISLQGLLQSSLNMVDQIMVGQLGEVTIAAVGIGLRPIFIFTFVTMALAGGGGVYAAQFWGKNDKDKIAQVIGSMLFLGGILALVATVVCVGYSQEVMELFSSDREVVSQGAIYQSINAIGFVPLVLAAVYSSVLRSTGYAKLVMQIGFLKVALNTIFNYYFIFARQGYPMFDADGMVMVGEVASSMEGIKGAAIATVMAQLTETAVIFIVIYTRKLPGAFHVKDILRVPSHILKPILVVSLPLVIGDLSWALGESVYMFLYGKMGTNEVAAMTITFPLQLFTVSFFFGFSSASAILIGQKLGAGKLQAGFIYAKKIYFTALKINIPLSLLVAFGSWYYVALYNVSDEVAEFSRMLCLIFALFFPIKVSNMIIGMGILRSGGDTRFTTNIGLCTIWLFAVPIGIFGVYILDVPVYVVYLLISLEEILRLVIVLKRVFSKKWVKNLVHDL